MVYLIRHGEPDYSNNGNAIYNGVGTNFAPLTENGVEQAIQAAGDKRLLNAKIIVSSPYTRALQTAAILSKELKINLHVDPGIYESYGETDEELRNRLETAIKRYSSYKKVIMVCHGMLIHSLYPDHWPEYCEITECDAQGDKTMLTEQPVSSLDNIGYVSIHTEHNGKCVLCFHKTRKSWEAPGGHVEPGELPLTAAKRELIEETGASDFDIYPLWDYAFSRESGELINNGRVYYAVVKSFSPLSPESEMEKIGFFEEHPEKTTYDRDTMKATYIKAKLAVKSLIKDVE